MQQITLISLSIETPRLYLIPCNPELLKGALAGNQQLQALLKATVPDQWTEFGERALQYVLEKIGADEKELGWWTYFPVHKEDNKLIGTCGYKGRPGPEGVVEIGYEITKDYRNRGLATEVAGALVRHALLHPAVKSVQAHTLGENNASTRVLTKCGFRKTGEIPDQEMGTIWKWTLVPPV